jgi:predicted porin
MNKKLMAAAVAGAFVAPAFVYAQNATVQVYGRANVEYGYVDQGSGRPNTDMFQTPGGSSVGFKGQEQLGGGLAAWFQCESSADVRGLNQDAFCSRNSAIGLRGGWGNLFFGKWDTPFKRAGSIGTVGTGETGVQGAAFLTFGNSTGAGAIGLGNRPLTPAEAGQAINRNVWKRRETGTINYESPDFSGFKVGLAFNAANATSAVDATTAPKPRVGSIGGTYSNGPLNIGLAYEKHWDFGNLGGANDDRAWTIGASYNFMGNLLVGVQYIDQKYEITTTSELKKKNWHVGADWNFGGPHHIMGAWTRAGDSKGNATAADLAAATAAGYGITSGNGAIVASGSDTGGDFWTIQYGYDFSKRTIGRIGYSRVSNDTNARYGLGGMATVPAGSAGTDQSAFFMYGQHSW